jgi:TonB family protein
MRRMLVVVAWVMLFVGAVGVWAQEAASAPVTDEWGKLVAANNLDVKGNTPFHLAMTFQLYDLDGKATKTGSFEGWWAAPGSEKIVVHLPGLNEDGSASAGSDAALVRDSYLVRQLLESAIHPVPAALRVAEAMTTKTVKFGKIPLDCTAPEASALQAMNAQPATLCMAPQTTDLLILQGLGGKESLLRARTGKFHDTYVALELRIGYLGRDAIMGNVTTLQSFDPAKSEVKLPPPAASQPKAVQISGGVIAGHRTGFVEPVYPDLAKIRHVSGLVLLQVVIGKDGSVERLVPIASTDSMFTNAAIQAVKQWKYSPYLLNGEPVEIDTTITVNFALNGG